jgi:glycosyltransferase involved in cell wall biosynthesis
MVSEMGPFNRMPADRGVCPGRITILMATCQGARHLPDQLASLADQTDPDWQLWVSDDGSRDATCAIVTEFARHHTVRLLQGPQRGAAQNFLALLTHPDLPPGPVAFADQDDVWLPGKLARARSCLAALPSDEPALYAAASHLVDADLRPLAQPRLPRIAPSFGNALVQNLFSGHTMVLNGPAVALARAAGAQPGIRYHDWWLYQLVAGAGGNLVLDRDCVALYRQHDANTLGAGRGTQAALRRVARLASGDWRATLQAHALALRQADGVLTPAARGTLNAFLDRFPPRGLARAAAFRRHGLTRSTQAAGLILQICAGIGRV